VRLCTKRTALREACHACKAMGSSFSLEANNNPQIILHG
jgi:hypothetical protein